QVRSKSFLISTAITLLLVIGGIVLSSIFGARADVRPVAVVGPVPAAVAEAELVEVTSVADRDEAEALVRSGDADAALVPSDGQLGFTLIALDEAPGSLVALLSVSPEVELLDP